MLYVIQVEGAGSNIEGNLVLDGQGNLYGAAQLGGNVCMDSQYCGTVFELERPTKNNLEWNYKVLYTFTGQPDGMQPFAGVTFDQEGNLWGTTFRGGTYGWGSVYRMTPPQEKGQGWTEEVIYSFSESNDDIISPEGPVAFDSSENLYGTTPTGGDAGCDGGSGCGVVYELAAPNWTYSTLYEFQGGDDGKNPAGYIVSDSQGNLYSTTIYGGEKDNAGIAFELSPPSNGGSWTETILHHFVGDEIRPSAGLTRGKWAELYGASESGGKYYEGTVFEIQP
jgi:uncharacterized repeat protein (TIGR03803 family)